MSQDIEIIRYPYTPEEVEERLDEFGNLTAYIIVDRFFADALSIAIEETLRGDVAAAEDLINELAEKIIGPFCFYDMYWELCEDVPESNNDEVVLKVNITPDMSD